jgi:hypothetical protein
MLSIERKPAKQLKVGDFYLSDLDRGADLIYQITEIRDSGDFPTDPPGRLSVSADARVDGMTFGQRRLLEPEAQVRVVRLTKEANEALALLRKHLAALKGGWKWSAEQGAIVPVEEG